MNSLRFAILTGLGLLLAGPGPRESRAAESWRAGTASEIITPELPLWMAGYGGRTKPAEGTLHPLWVRVLALEDAGGHRGIVLASDTLGFPRGLADAVLAQLKERHQLDPGQVMLHSSHTHCGPVLHHALSDIYPLDDTQRERIQAYSEKLVDRIVATVGRALEDLEPVTLQAGQGVSHFAVNRRNNVESDVPALRQADRLLGPVDHDVPVLAAYRPDLTLKAVAFGYACHNTTLSFYQWAGDYAGFAQLALEESHPGATALFYMGCGADQNPLPRREVSLAKRYGHMLAAAVEETLLQPLRALEPRLQTVREDITLDLGPAPTREELEPLAKGSVNYRQRWAARLLGELEAGRSFRRTYPYPVQVWRLGREQVWITLGGEVVVDYALRFKAAFGPTTTWVAGYCNDVMAYIPSTRVLREDIPPRASGRWGYEGNTSMMVYGLPAHRWADDTEDRIGAAVRRLVLEARSDESQP